MSAKHETKAFGTGTAMFGRLPRRRWAGWVIVLAWLGLAAAFAGDLVPTSSPGDWLYGVEARRDAYAKALAREKEKEVQKAPRPPVPVAAASPARDSGTN